MKRNGRPSIEYMGSGGYQVIPRQCVHGHYLVLCRSKDIAGETLQVNSQVSMIGNADL
jgi:hypothetical protein